MWQRPQVLWEEIAVEKRTDLAIEYLDTTVKCVEALIATEFGKMMLISENNLLLEVKLERVHLTTIPACELF